MIRSSASPAARAGDERVRIERAGRPSAGEHRIVERDLVVGRRGSPTIGIDIAGAERGGEGEHVGAAEADQLVVAALAVEHVGAGIADRCCWPISLPVRSIAVGRAMAGGRQDLDRWPARSV